MEIWTIVGTILGALIAGLSVLLNSIYSSKSVKKREDRNRLIAEKDRDIKELEILYEKSLQLFDRLIRELGALPSPELEEFYKINIRLELISTKSIIKKVKELRNGISEMAKALPAMHEDFIPKFEDDHDRKYRLEKRKIVMEERKAKSKEFTSSLTTIFKELSELMKKDLQDRRLLNIEGYIQLRKNS